MDDDERTLSGSFGDSSVGEDKAVTEPLIPTDPTNDDQPAHYEFITENVYLTERQSSKEKKKAKKMICDCIFYEEEDDPSEACGSSCLNRLLMIECGNRCLCGEYCTNKRFQKASYARAEVFKTEMKGWGLRATQDIPPDTFVMEYCGEVCTHEEFAQRKVNYQRTGRRHYYFMSLKSDEILDATHRGNLSRFINHSCEPNCETQKWTVNGMLRVGFFSLKPIAKGEELTFDYKFQRFGEAAQKCFCGSSNCRGMLGAPPPKESKKLIDSVNKKNKKRKEAVVDLMDEDEKIIYDVVGQRGRLVSIEQVLPLSRAMILAESSKLRKMFLTVLQDTRDTNCLKRFLSYQGLPLLWSWMIDSSDADMKIELLNTLKHLPIASKNQIEDTKVLHVVQKWSTSGSATSDKPTMQKRDIQIPHSKKQDVTNEGEIPSERKNSPTLHEAVYAEPNLALTEQELAETVPRDTPTELVDTLRDLECPSNEQGNQPLGITNVQNCKVDTQVKQSDELVIREDVQNMPQTDLSEPQDTLSEPKDAPIKQEDTPIEVVLIEQDTQDEDEGTLIEQEDTQDEDEGTLIEQEDTQDEHEGALIEQEDTHDEHEGALIEQEDTQDEHEGALIEQEDTQDEHEGVLIEQEDTQDEHEGALIEQEDTQDEHEGALIEQEDTQDEHEGAPIEQEDTQDEHEGTLIEQGDTHDEHEGALIEQEDTQDEHEGALIEHGGAMGHTSTIQCDDVPIGHQTLPENQTTDKLNTLDSFRSIAVDQSDFQNEEGSLSVIKEELMDKDEEKAEGEAASEDNTGGLAMLPEPNLMEVSPVTPKGSVDVAADSDDIGYSGTYFEMEEAHEANSQSEVEGDNKDGLTQNNEFQMEFNEYSGDQSEGSGTEVDESNNRVVLATKAEGINMSDDASDFEDSQPSVVKGSQEEDDDQPIDIESIESSNDKEENCDTLVSKSEDRVYILAQELLEDWSSLKEVFRIPKKARKKSTDFSKDPFELETTVEKAKRDLPSTDKEMVWPSPLNQHSRKRRSYYSGSERKSKQRYHSKSHHLFSTLSPLNAREARSSSNTPPHHSQREDSRNSSLYSTPNSSHSKSSLAKSLQTLSNHQQSNYHRNSPDDPFSIQTSNHATLPLEPNVSLTRHVSSFSPLLAKGLLPALTAAAISPKLTYFGQSPIKVGKSTDQNSQLIQSQSPTTFKSSIELNPLQLSNQNSGEKVPTEMNNPLPKNWRMVYDNLGNPYFYHIYTRKSQWDRPTMEDEEENPIETVEMMMSTPSPSSEDEKGDQNASSLKIPRTPEESPPPTEEEESGEYVTSTTDASACKDNFKVELSKLIIHCLGKHRKVDCKYGKITSTDDFKHLARKLTHAIIEKESARKGDSDKLTFNPSVKAKTKDFVKQYMKKCGSIYKRK